MAIAQYEKSIQRTPIQKIHRQNPYSRNCLGNNVLCAAKDFEDDTGLEIQREDDPDALYVGTLLACGVVQRFEKAAQAAGPNLTRATLMQAIGNLGTIEMPFVGGPGTYRPDKLDGADFYRPQVWRKGCKCWHPIVPQFQRGKH